MTPEQIDVMEAGREIDAAVAVECFGYEWRKDRRAWARKLSEDGNFGLWSPKNGPLVATRREGEICVLSGDRIPHYSTDPAAAADVKRWLWERGWETDSGWYDREGELTAEVYYGRRGGATDEAEIIIAPITGDPIAAECLCLARVALAVAGKGEKG